MKHLYAALTLCLVITLPAEAQKSKSKQTPVQKKPLTHDVYDDLK